MNLGNAIQTLRKEQKISRKDLAERSCLSVTALYNIENNLSFPSKDTIERICSSLNIPISFLMFFSITEDDIPEDKRSSFHYLQEPMKKFLMEK
jgi:transcriptional regulator with XRE-family HTH domain